MHHKQGGVWSLEWRPATHSETRSIKSCPKGHQHHSSKGFCRHGMMIMLCIHTSCTVVLLYIYIYIALLGLIILYHSMQRRSDHFPISLAPRLVYYTSNIIGANFFCWPFSTVQIWVQSKHIQIKHTRKQLMKEIPSNHLACIPWIFKFICCIMSSINNTILEMIILNICRTVSF